MFTLYTTPLSANGRKVLAVSHHLGLQPEVKLINVYKGEGRTPEYLSINPWGKIPTLVDGELTLWESNAILQYLSEAYGEYRLWSREPKQRADVSRWLFWEAATPAPVTMEWGDERFQSLAKFLDAHLSGRAFLVGDALSLADFSIAAMMMYARPAGFPFDAFPQLRTWYERMEGLDAWRVTAAGPWR